MEKAKDDVKAMLKVLNNYLLTRTFLVGEGITVADIVLACTLYHPYKSLFDPDFRKPYGNVNRWFLTLVNQPQFQAVIGEFTLCEKVPEINPKKYAENQAIFGKYLHSYTLSCSSNLFYYIVLDCWNYVFKGKLGKDKKEKKESKAQDKLKKQVQFKKEAEKVSEKEPEEELDAADAALAEEPKSKDPFDAMPKGTFNMDEFKRSYSNEDESKSIAYFWEHFDSENYSIWYGEYKYREELTKVFMSCNLITGK